MEEIRKDFSKQNLTGQDFSNQNLTGQDFSNQNLNNANFSEANLINANFSNAILNNANLSNAILNNANFSEADLSGANLNETILLRTNLSNAILNNAIFTHSFLMGADLSGANLTRADLTDANLTRANLNQANFSEAILNNAIFIYSMLIRANLTDANLTSANLTSTNLTRANLTRANLTRADLTGANLTRADLTGANLTGANLTRAVLTDAVLTDVIGIPELQPQHGVAFEIHNAFDKIQKIKDEYLNIINITDNTPLTFPKIKELFIENINSLLFNESETERKIKQLNAVFNKVNNYNIPPIHVLLVSKSIRFAFLQNNDFKKHYIDIYLDETSNAYSGPNDNTSCVKGIMERLVTSIGQTVAFLCVENGCVDNPVYLQLNNLINLPFDINQAAKEWYIMQDESTDRRTESERTNSFIEYVTKKATDMGKYNETLSKEIKKYADENSQMIKKLILGGFKKNKKCKKHKSKKYKHKSKKYKHKSKKHKHKSK